MEESIVFFPTRARPLTVDKARHFLNHAREESYNGNGNRKYCYERMW